MASINDGYLRAIPSDTDRDDGRLYDPTQPDASTSRFPFAPLVVSVRRYAVAVGFGLSIGRAPALEQPQAVLPTAILPTVVRLVVGRIQTAPIVLRAEGTKLQVGLLPTVVRAPHTTLGSRPWIGYAAPASSPAIVVATPARPLVVSVQSHGVRVSPIILLGGGVRPSIPPYNGPGSVGVGAYIPWDREKRPKHVQTRPTGYFDLRPSLAELKRQAAEQDKTLQQVEQEWDVFLMTLLHELEDM